jgi:translation initiation factor 2B subunit (eIF-2B alpha/beta/delta family)
VDTKLKRELAAIGRDRTSGAAELALRTVDALDSWIRRSHKITELQLLEVAKTLLNAQPEMAPLLRLANEAALSIDAKDPGKSLLSACKAFRLLVTNGPKRIADLFLKSLPKTQRYIIVTYSYSSTVLRTLIRARGRIVSVSCSEGRPNYEGRVMAEELAAAGMIVELATDAGLTSTGFSRRQGLFVVGADDIVDTGRYLYFVNKVGTKVLTWCASAEGVRTVVLADTSKFVPPELSEFQRKREELSPADEVWPHPPRGVSIINDYFESICFSRGARILTEKGWMTPKQVRRELKEIKVSPRLKELVK